MHINFRATVFLQLLSIGLISIFLSFNLNASEELEGFVRETGFDCVSVYECMDKVNELIYVDRKQSNDSILRPELIANKLLQFDHEVVIEKVAPLCYGN